MYSSPLFSPHQQSSGALPNIDRFNQVVVVFRENQAYEGVIKSAIQDLRESGREVKLVTFPRGCSPEVIRARMTQLLPDLDGKYIFADRTVIENSDIVEASQNRLGTLDEVFSEASSQLLAEVLAIDGFQEAYEKFREAREKFDKDSKAYRASLERYYRAFTKTLVKLFEQALEEKSPDQIIIIAESLKSHLPFSYPLGTKSPEQRIKEAIIEAGYAGENITICKTTADFEKLGEVDFENTWIVADRHIPVHHHITELLREMHRQEAKQDGILIEDADDFEMGDRPWDDKNSTEELWEDGHSILDGTADSRSQNSIPGDPIEEEDMALNGLDFSTSCDGDTFIDLPVDTTVISLPIESLTLSFEQLGLIRLKDHSKWPSRVSEAMRRNLAIAELFLNHKSNGQAH